MAWDSTKPANSAALVSSVIRQNWDALARTLGGVNLVADPVFLIWAGGDAVAPTHWVAGGAGVAIARTGTGLGDTRRKVGKFCAKVTAGGGATGTLSQQILPTATFDDFLDGLSMGLGAWVWTTSVSSVRLYIADGATTTFSSFHTGNGGAGAWEWLSFAHVVSASATKVEVGISANASTVGYLSGPTLLLGEVPPSYYQPAPVGYGTLHFPQAGTLSTGTKKGMFAPARPGIVKDVQLRCETAPTTQAVIVDVNTWDGSAFTSMYSTRPQIAAAGNQGGAQPDGTYARRCLSGLHGTSLVAGGLLSVDTDQVGTGTLGADMIVEVRVLQYLRPLEAFLGYNEFA